MNFVVSHAVKENMRRKCYFIVCLFACFLVTLVSLISKTVVTQGSLIFLTLGEKETGEMDIILTPLKSERSRRHKNITDHFLDYAFINYTKYISIISGSNDVKDSLDTTTIRMRSYCSHSHCEFYRNNHWKFDILYNVSSMADVHEHFS